MKKSIGIIIGMAALILCTIVAPSLYSQAKEEKASYIYDSPREALSAGVQEQDDDAIVPFSLEERILLQKEHDGRTYYLVKKHYEEEGNHEDSVYVAVAEGKHGKYRFGKYSADVSLATPIGIESGGLHFAAGKVRDSSETPCASTGLLQVDDEGIYAAVSETPPEIRIIEGES